MKTIVKFTPLAIIIILIGLVITIPNIFEFDSGLNQSIVVPTGQYLASEFWMWIYIFYTIFTFFYIWFVHDNSSVYSSNKNAGTFIFNIQLLETLKGKYYYKIDEVADKVRIYRFDYINFTEILGYNFSLYKGITTADITNKLDSIARQIDESNYSYIKEELSTWKRFK